jgi:hypothetical protein
MCKLEAIKWGVVKSNKPISKNLSTKLNKIRFGFVQDNIYSFYYLNDNDFEKIYSVLVGYKRQSFKIVRFYDKQFGLTINWFNQSNYDFSKIVKELPLSKKFYWFNKDSDRQSVTPITTKQYNNMIQIN